MAKKKGTIVYLSETAKKKLESIAAKWEVSQSSVMQRLIMECEWIDRDRGWRLKLDCREGTLADTKEIDYKDLLKKYMTSVIEEEGIDYIFHSPQFSEAEIEELERISKEIQQSLNDSGREEPRK